FTSFNRYIVQSISPGLILPGIGTELRAKCRNAMSWPVVFTIRQFLLTGLGEGIQPGVVAEFK
ncbi:MAG: hypothetical protein V2I47_02230, partial [Bacteroidales bacterium]|nr:hypothetical protein [Bacteroidales bacterium]